MLKKKTIIIVAIVIFIILLFTTILIVYLKNSYTFPPDKISGLYIFSPGDDSNTQDIINTAFKTQGGVSPENNGQNSLSNYAFLFMPGTYNLDIPIGYYTHVAGLGKSNEKVIINGGPNVLNSSTNPSVGALNNFWRTCENMTVNPLLGNDPNRMIDGTDTEQVIHQDTMVYAVSQASSLRSVNINGSLHMGALLSVPQPIVWAMGLSSGGFMANCKISKDIRMGSQQQFICRNTEYDSFPDYLWNQVNVGCKEKGLVPTIAQTDICKTGLSVNGQNPRNLTIVGETPKVFEKPYLAVLNDTDKTSIIVMIPGQSPPIGNSNVIPTNYILKNNYKIIGTNWKAVDINKLLLKQEIKCVIFSPGRYNLDRPINLNGKLLFGLGVPILRSTNNNSIITGYGQICGLICEAGPFINGMTNNNILVNLNSGNPSYLWDIVCRVGGGDKNNDIYSVDKMLYIGGDDSILDNTWCWVADHYSNNEYTLWDKAICNIGVHVTGKRVIAYGLFSEHTRKRNVLWDGDAGQVYMFQSEFNYFPPTQNDFNDIASYEVSPNVNSHIIRGAGAYSFFPNINVARTDTTTLPTNIIYANSGFKFNISKVDYKTIITVFLNGFGGIKSVINNDGNIVQLVSSAKKPATQVYTICNK
jgi:hypothetical protein